jgi:tripartite-type tricarboxylate transporter receptor subunit TctC
MAGTRTCLMAAGLAVLASISGAWAQDVGNWPNRPVRVIVNYGPGGSTDNATRPYLQPLAAALGQQVVIENKGGAAGAIGVEAAAKSPPDGYTFLATPVAAVTILPHARKVAYDPFKDLVPVIKYADAITLLTVHPSLGVNTVQELVALAKKQPGKLNYGGVGLGTLTQLSAIMLNKAAGIDILYVPYRGAGEALPDILAGVVQVYFDPNALPQVTAGKLKILGVFDRERHPDFPNTPIMTEIYPELDTVGWFGIFAPAGTPDAIVRRMNAAVAQVSRSPEIKARLLKYAIRATVNTPEEFSAELRRDYERYGTLVREYGITLD